MYRSFLVQSLLLHVIQALSRLDAPLDESHVPQVPACEEHEEEAGVDFGQDRRSQHPEGEIGRELVEVEKPESRVVRHLDAVDCHGTEAEAPLDDEQQHHPELDQRLAI